MVAILKTELDYQCDFCDNRKNNAGLRVMLKVTDAGMFPVVICDKCYASHNNRYSIFVSRPMCQHWDCLNLASVIVSFDDYGKAFCHTHGRQCADWSKQLDTWKIEHQAKELEHAI